MSEDTSGRRVPWGWLGAVALLGASIVIALVNGRTFEAVVVAVLMLPAAVFLVVWFYVECIRR